MTTDDNYADPGSRDLSQREEMRAEAERVAAGKAATRAANHTAHIALAEKNALLKLHSISGDEFIETAKEGLEAITRAVIAGDIKIGVSDDVIDLMYKLTLRSIRPDYEYATEASILCRDFETLMRAQKNARLFFNKMKARATSDRLKQSTEERELLDQINGKYCRAQKGGSVQIMALREGRGDGLVAKFEPMTLQAFVLASTEKFAPPSATNGKRKNAHLWWLEQPELNKCHDVIFDPGAPERTGVLNYWSGFMLQPKHIDGFMERSLFIQYVRDVVAAGNPQHFKWIFGWLAHLFQKPGQRKRTAIVLKGGQGAGKTTLPEAIGSLLGEHYTHVNNAHDFLGHFNSHLAIAKLVLAEEAVYASRKDGASILKDIITSDYGFVEHKNKDKIRVRKYADFIMVSDGDWVVSANFEGERRFAVFEVPPPEVDNADDYFAAIKAEVSDPDHMKALLWELLHFDLSDIDVNKIPKTQALLNQKIRSLNSYGAFIYNLLDTGVMPWFFDRNTGEIKKDALFHEFKRSAGPREAVDQGQFGKALLKLLNANGGFKSARHQSDENGNKIQRQYYVFPSLQECRRSFEKVGKQPNEEWATAEAMGQTWEVREKPSDASIAAATLLRLAAEGGQERGPIDDSKVQL